MKFSTNQMIAFTVTATTAGLIVYYNYSGSVQSEPTAEKNNVEEIQQGDALIEKGNVIYEKLTSLFK
jgi:hypothetical protein